MKKTEEGTRPEEEEDEMAGNRAGTDTVLLSHPETTQPHSALEWPTVTPQSTSGSYV